MLITLILLDFSDIDKNKDNDKILCLLYLVKVSFFFTAMYNQIKLNYSKCSTFTVPFTF